MGKKTYPSKILSLLQPPKTIFAGDGDWQAAEKQLGTLLPEDYKWFASTYGVGGIGNHGSGEPYMDCVTPFTGGGLQTLIETGSANTQIYIDRFVKAPDRPRLFPEPGGLLPFSCLRSCKYLYWKTVGNPDGWDMVLWDDGSLQLRSLPGITLSDFLLEMLTKKEVIVDGISMGGGWLDDPAFIAFDPTAGTYIVPA